MRTAAAIVGIAMVAAVFFGMIAATAWDAGWRAALAIWAFAVVVTALLTGGVALAARGLGA
jgi:hypothetical protein